MTRPILRTVLSSLGVALSATSGSAQWQEQASGTTASFRGLSIVSDRVAWASGSGGTVVRTTNGGATWRVMRVPGADSLDFRDIAAFDARHAYVLSIGNGSASRIYKTVNGGGTWTPIDTVALNAVAFARGRGLAGWAVGPGGRIVKWTGLELDAAPAELRLRVRKEPP